MSVRDGFGELRDNARPSDPFMAVCIVTHSVARQGNEQHTAFISAADLRIVSSALAQLIAYAGKRANGASERAEVMRAREMMDWVDDELYALSLATTLHKPAT